MALIPLNKFVTKTSKLNSGTEYTTATTVYTAPVGTTAIVLMAQVANIGTSSERVNFVHWRNIPILADAQGNGAQPGQTPSFLVKDFEVPKEDAAAVLVGKLILESLDSIRAYTTSTNTGTLQLTLSVLETAND